MFGDLSNESKNPPENLHISGINSVRERPILRHSSGETRMIAKSAVVTSSYCTTFNRTVVRILVLFNGLHRASEFAHAPIHGEAPIFIPRTGRLSSKGSN